MGYPPVVMGRRGSPDGVDPRFIRDEQELAYMTLHRSGELTERAARAVEELGECRACPRNCAVDRLAGEIGVCNTGRHAVVSSAFAHHGEEDCLRGRAGSGNIFFSACNHPATTMVEVRRLIDPSMLIEIEADAVGPEDPCVR